MHAHTHAHTPIQTFLYLKVEGKMWLKFVSRTDFKGSMEKKALSGHLVTDRCKAVQESFFFFFPDISLNLSAVLHDEL